MKQLGDKKLGREIDPVSESKGKVHSVVTQRVVAMLRTLV